MLEYIMKKLLIITFLFLTACKINFTADLYTSDLIELAKSMGSVNSELTTKQEDKIINSYWDFMANMILLLEEEIKPKEEIIETMLFRKYG